MLVSNKSNITNISDNVPEKQNCQKVAYEEALHIRVILGDS